MADRDEAERRTSLRSRAEGKLGVADRDVKNMSPEEVGHLVHELQTHQIELEMQNEELRRAQDELLESRNRFSDLFDFAPFGYLTVSPKGLILEANLTLAEMLDVPRVQLLKSRLAHFVVEADQDDYYHNLRTILKHEGTRVFELSLRRASGDHFWARSEWKVIEGEDNPRIRVTLCDITEQKRLRAQLALSDRMASVGILAAGVAHEINNPLTYVLFNLESLAAELRQLPGPAADSPNSSGPDLADLIDLADSAVDGTHRIRDIAKHLRVFSHQDDDCVAPLNINHAIDSAIGMVANELKFRAQLVKNYGELPRVMANNGRLCQVFLNLLVNATHAIDEGDVENNKVIIRSWQDGSQVFIEVKDTGIGIPENIMDRIFEPFFTTKDVGSGSGLGLSICQKIITSYGGQISAESSEGKGSRFTVCLPIGLKPESSQEQGSKHEPPPGQILHGRILVIDDEPMVGKVVARIMAEHEVVVVGSGAEGREIIEADAGFDVIFCDLMMPGVSGMHLYAWLAEEHPDLASRMVFMTGGAFTPQSRRILGDVPNMLVEKPFDTATLSSLVQRLLQAAQADEAT